MRNWILLIIATHISSCGTGGNISIPYIEIGECYLKSEYPTNKIVRIESVTLSGYIVKEWNDSIVGFDHPVTYEVSSQDVSNWDKYGCPLVIID